MTTGIAAPPVRGSRAGILALVLGIVAIVAAVIPFLSYVAWAIGIAAIVVGIVGLARGRLLKKGGAIAGIVLGAVAVILSIALSVVYTTVFFLASVASNLPTALPSDLSSASSTPLASSTAGQNSVTYRVTGSGKATTISYLTADSSGSGTDQVSDASLPWTKTVAINDDGAFSTTVFSLTAQTGASGGKITCEIEADGKVISKHSSSGQYSVVSCSGTTS